MSRDVVDDPASKGFPAVQQFQHPGPHVAFIFPGQGSQLPGMGQAVHDASPAARRVFAEADAVLGRPITELCLTAPAEVLEDTATAQPTILTASIAMLAAIREQAGLGGEAIVPHVLAGHSLGEFTAMVAAGALDFASALRLVQERGSLMRDAGSERPGGMAAVIGLDDEVLIGICQAAGEHGIVTVANLNCPGQAVISGELGALGRAMELATASGARKVVRLPVSIASHSPLMSDVALRLGQLIADAPVREPDVPVVANITARPLDSVDAIRAELSASVENPVNWTGSVRAMIDRGATTFIEVGPGQVLSSLIKRISRDVTILPGQELLFGRPAR